MTTRRAVWAAAAALIATGLAVVVCDDGKDDIPPGALLTDGQATTIAVGESVWVMSGESGRALGREWSVQPQAHMLVDETRSFVTDPCDRDETGCPGRLDGFRVSFDAPGEYVVRVIMCIVEEECDPNSPPDARTYNIEVAASAD